MHLGFDRTVGVTPHVSSGRGPAAGKPMVLLVHGFNNDTVEAKDSYFTMRSNLENILQFCAIDEARRRAIQASIWEFYWPGYEPFSEQGKQGLRRKENESKWAAGLYFLEVIKARTWVADRLAEYLREAAPSEIFFIGHSLGNRVILETIERLRDQRRIAISGFVMLAGAVPVHFLTAHGPLHQAVMTGKGRFCFYSWRDVVLTGPFPLGQVLAGEWPPGFMPMATGTAGWPAGTYTGRSNTKLGHSDYWKQGIFLDEDRSQETLASIFRIAAARGLPEEWLPRLDSGGRLSILPSRHLEEWRIPGDHWLRDEFGPSSRA